MSNCNIRAEYAPRRIVLCRECANAQEVRATMNGATIIRCRLSSTAVEPHGYCYKGVRRRATEGS